MKLNKNILSDINVSSDIKVKHEVFFYKNNTIFCFSNHRLILISLLDIIFKS